MQEHAGRQHDLGQGFTITEYLDENDELIGYSVTGPAAPQCPSPYGGRCGGLCAVRPHQVVYEGRVVRTYSVWQVSGEWPNITLSPSVACDCGGQHSFVREGRWV